MGHLQRWYVAPADREWHWRSCCSRLVRSAATSYVLPASSRTDREAHISIAGPDSTRRGRARSDVTPAGTAPPRVVRSNGRRRREARNLAEGQRPGGRGRHQYRSTTRFDNASSHFSSGPPMRARGSYNRDTPRRGPVRAAGIGAVSRHRRRSGHGVSSVRPRGDRSEDRGGQRH